MKVVSAEFLTSAVHEEGWPAPQAPEIAFAGRSNVGKSSMLNKLAGRGGLARVSNTPGRTRTLNFFELTLERGGGLERLRFCDLPGYGFAKVSKTERAGWAAMIEGYLTRRAPLRAVVTILDCRVGATDDDKELLAWLARCGRPAIPVATKVDKLPKARRATRLRQMEGELGLPPRSLLGFSSVEGIGRDELWAKLVAAAHGNGVGGAH